VVSAVIARLAISVGLIGWGGAVGALQGSGTASLAGRAGNSAEKPGHDAERVHHGALIAPVMAPVQHWSAAPLERVSQKYYSNSGNNHFQYHYLVL
jgi:hypothetical protein